MEMQVDQQFEGQSSGKNPYDWFLEFKKLPRELRATYLR